MKIYDIRYTPDALRDMDKVWEDVYAASSDFDTADKYVSEFTEKIEEQTKFPEKGIPLEYRGLFTGFYMVIYKKYAAFYRIKDDFVDIIRIIMTKADYMNILFGDTVK